MNKNILLGSAALIAALLAGQASAAMPVASDTASASMTLLRPLSVAKTQDMGFGAIVQGTGTVTLAADGTLTTGGTTDKTASSSGSVKTANFTITGEGAQDISITVPASFQLTSSADSNSKLTVSVLHNIATPAHTVLSGALAAQGQTSFNVGGSFALNGSEATGTYTGSFTVSANYN